MARDKKEVVRREYNLIYANFDVGYVVSAQTQAAINAQYVDVTDAAQFNGILKSWTNGATPTVNVQMMQTAYNNLFGKIGKNQFYPVVDGAKVGYGMGTRVKELFGEQLILRPVDAEPGDYSQDICFWLAEPDFSQVSIGGDRDNRQIATVPFKIFPDETKPLDYNYVMFGDWTAVETDPNGILVQFAERVQKPYKHVDAVGIGSKAKIQGQAYGFYAQPTTVTAAINNLAGIALTDQTIDFDGLSSPNGLNVDDIIKIGTEYLRVEAVSYGTTTSGTATVIRGIGGNDATTHADNDAITVQKDLYIFNVTRRASWAAVAGGIFTVGNSNISENKGLIEAVAAGSDDVEATVGAKISQATTVTVAA